MNTYDYVVVISLVTQLSKAVLRVAVENINHDNMIYPGGSHNKTQERTSLTCLTL